MSGLDCVQIICTPIRAPNANAVAETLDRDRLPRVPRPPMLVGRPHLVDVLRGYVEHYNQHRPHRSLGLGTPIPSVRGDPTSATALPQLRRREILGGLNRPGVSGGSGMPLVVWSRGAGLPHATVLGWRVSNSIGLSMPRELWRRWRL